MKKRGMLQEVFYYIFAAVLIALIFAFGYQQITRLQNLNEQAKFITFKTTDGVFFVLSPTKVLNDEEKLSATYQYPISKFVQELLSIHRGDIKK